MRFLTTILVLLSVLSAQSVFRRPIVLPVSGPIAPVNSAGTADGSAATTIAAPATSLTTGNLIVVAVRWFTATTVTSVTDTAGNTYTRITGIIYATGSLDLWYAQNTLANASNIVTATFSATSEYRSILTSQYSGLKTTGALDVTATGSSASNTIVHSGLFTTTQASELIVSAVSSDTGGEWTPNSGHTLRVEDFAIAAAALQDKIVMTIQTGISVGFVSTVSDDKRIAVATFKGN